MCIYITVICASKNKHGGNNWGTHEPIFSLGHFTAEAAPARHLDTSKEEKKKKNMQHCFLGQGVCSQVFYSWGCPKHIVSVTFVVFGMN